MRPGHRQHSEPQNQRNERMHPTCATPPNKRSAAASFNKALERTAAGRRGRNRRVLWPPSLSSFGELADLHVSVTLSAMKKSTKREFTVIVERDEDGYYVASVPELRGCHTQARSLDRLMTRVRDAIALCLEIEDESRRASEFVGVQRVTI